MKQRMERWKHLWMTGALLMAAVIQLRNTAEAQSEPLPPPPDAVMLQFTGPEDSYPPHVLDMTSVRPVESTNIPGGLTEAWADRIRAFVLQDLDVLATLGDRYAYVMIDQLEPEKTEQFRPSPFVDVTFFSHSLNMAVLVHVYADLFSGGFQIVGIEPRPDLNPPEGRDEITAATQLAAADPRISELVQELTADGIAFFDDNPFGPSNRLIYVSFTKEEDQTLYFAVVDLTNQFVLDAGAVGGE